MENCRHVMGRGTPEPELEAATERLFIHLVTNYLDLLRVPVLRRRVTTLVQLDRRAVDELMAGNRGVVVVTGHIGNHDLAGAYMAASGFPISAVVEPVPGGWAKTFNRYRGATSMETIPIPDRPAMVKALERGRMLALVSDRDLTGRGILCPAFDSYRYYPKGAAAYTLRFKTPLLIAACVFQYEPGRPPYRIVYWPLEFAPTGDGNVDIPALTRLIAENINEFIRRYPDQWLVFKAGWQQQ
jgi:KDO2-lipid IV(A) lauroyltransferase